MTQPTEETFNGSGGLELFMRSWRPAGAPRAVVAICPGFNSHSGEYGWVAEQLVAAGCAVYAIDLRGRGKSEGQRFDIQSIDEYVEDLIDLVRIAKSREPGLPVFLLGHSAGGVVACIYCLEHQFALAGLICESFAFQVPAPDLALQILKGASHLAPHAGALTLHNKDFSRDPAVVAAKDADPLIAHETQTIATVAALVRADELLKENFSEIALPVLILHGTEDHAARYSGSEQFFEKARSEDKTIKLYNGHYHDLLNDLGKEEVMADILAWIDERV